MAIGVRLNSQGRQVRAWPVGSNAEGHSAIFSAMSHFNIEENFSLSDTGTMDSDESSEESEEVQLERPEKEKAAWVRLKLIF